MVRSNPPWVQLRMPSLSCVRRQLALPQGGQPALGGNPIREDGLLDESSWNVSRLVSESLRRHHTPPEIQAPGFSRGVVDGIVL